jgi:hypothetical protein
MNWKRLLLALARGGNAPGRRDRNRRHCQQQGRDRHSHPGQNRFAPTPAPGLADRSERAGVDWFVAKEAVQFLAQLVRRVARGADCPGVTAGLLGWEEVRRAEDLAGQGK